MDKTGTRNQAALEAILSNTRHLNYCLRSSQFFLHMGVRSRKTGIIVLRKLKVVIKSRLTELAQWFLWRGTGGWRNIQDPQ